MENIKYLKKILAIAAIVSVSTLIPIECEATWEINLQNLRDMVQFSTGENSLINSLA